MSKAPETKPEMKNYVVVTAAGQNVAVMAEWRRLLKEDSSSSQQGMS
jgi:hypothetical protein